MKDWTGDSNSIFKQLGASNHCEEEREANDYYATDPRAIDDLLSIEKFSNDIWECASGGGHLVKKLRHYGYSVWSTDLINRDNQDDIMDFLKCSKPYKGDIITNPPYKYATEFVLKALQLIEPDHKVAMFLKLSFLEGGDRFLKIFRKHPPIRVHVYSKRIQCAKNGEFKGTSAVCYAWFIWEKDFKGKPTIDWIYR